MGQSPACPAVSSRDPAPRPASTAAWGPGAPSAPGPSQGVVVRLPLHALDAVPAGPRSRGAWARTAARVHRHPPVDLPGGVGPGDQGRLDALPHPVQLPGAEAGRTPSTRARSGPARRAKAPRPGCATARRRSWRAAGSGGACPAPEGRAAVARAAPTGHRSDHGGRMRLYSSSEAFAGIAIRFHTTRDTPRASPRPARHAAPTRLTQHALELEPAQDRLAAGAGRVGPRPPTRRNRRKRHAKPAESAHPVDNRARLAGDGPSPSPVGARHGGTPAAVGRVGLLGRSGAGACPNLPQRRPEPGSAASRGAEYQRFSSRAPARSGPLWQIWTTGVPRPTGKGGHRSDGEPGARPDDHAGPAGASPGPRPATETAHQPARPVPRSRRAARRGAADRPRDVHFPPVSRVVSAGFACFFRRFCHVS